MKTRGIRFRHFSVRIVVIVIIAFVQIAAHTADAQTPRPSFEVASVKPGNADDSLAFRLQPGGRFLVRGASLQVLIADAWDVQEYQISGLPAWAKSEKFSIEAKTSSPIPPWPDSNKVLAAMVQSLIEERFALAAHRESRQDTIYNLVPAKSGFRLQPADPNAPNGFEVLPRQIHSMAVPLSYLAEALAGMLGHPVNDRTNIAGKYDFRLNYTPDSSPDPDAAYPSIFTALEQQLGLKLEASKGPVETIVIDRVEKLREN